MTKRGPKITPTISNSIQSYNSRGGFLTLPWEEQAGGLYFASIGVLAIVVIIIGTILIGGGPITWPLALLFLISGAGVLLSVGIQSLKQNLPFWLIIAGFVLLLLKLRRK